MIDKAKDHKDFQQILDLQNRNLEKSLTPNEVTAEGFVSARHTVELLEQMNHPYPHIVAKQDGKIIGFTLVMLRSFQNVLPLLVPLFNNINSINYKDQLLKDTSYFVMGQVCIDKSNRRQGWFRKLYHGLRDQMRPHFDYCITGISQRNIRSIEAHKSIGFEKILAYSDEKGDWIIVLWAF